MKKMNKTYEAPEAEIIEMQMPTSLLEVSIVGGGGNEVGGNTGLS